MRYLLQVYFNGALQRLEQLPVVDRAEVVQEYTAFFASPEIRDGNQLQPLASAVTVRVRDGELMWTDARSARPANRSAATTWSRSTTVTPPLHWPRASRRYAWARPSRCGRSSSATQPLKPTSERVGNQETRTA